MEAYDITFAMIDTEDMEEIYYEEEADTVKEAFVALYDEEDYDELFLAWEGLVRYASLYYEEEYEV